MDFVPRGAEGKRVILMLDENLIGLSSETGIQRSVPVLKYLKASGERFTLLLMDLY
jgi:hypothetical protein